MRPRGVGAASCAARGAQAPHAVSREGPFSPLCSLSAKQCASRSSRERCACASCFPRLCKGRLGLGPPTRRAKQAPYQRVRSLVLARTPWHSMRERGSMRQQEARCQERAASGWAPCAHVGTFRGLAPTTDRMRGWTTPRGSPLSSGACPRRISSPQHGRARSISGWYRL